MIKKNWPPYFLFGTLASSIGSQLFFISLLASLGHRSVETIFVSILVGGIRFAPLFSLFFIARKVDVWSPRKVVIYSEIVAAAFSVGIFFIWPYATEYFWFFSLLCIGRAAAVAAQTGARNRILKALSTNESSTDNKLAVWLNKVTHGGILISAVLSVYLTSVQDFRTAIVVDFFTFLICGVFTLIVPELQSEKESSSNFRLAFINFYQTARNVAISDLALSIVMAGLNMYIFRLSNGNPTQTSFLFVIYGASIWLSGFALRIPYIQSINLGAWLIIGVSYIGIALLDDMFLKAFLFFMVNMSYWHLFHRYSGIIQNRFSIDQIASATVARTIQMLTILFIGEWFVGLASLHFSYSEESVVRGLLAVCFGLLLRNKL